jgi:uncharacterized protein YndB with AHSA1/START domain
VTDAFVGPARAEAWSRLWESNTLRAGPERRTRTATRETTVADYVATAVTAISASPTQVWAALTDPEQIKKYMYGTQVETDWQRGSRIVWKGEYEGRAYEDKGEIVEVDPPHHLKMTHFSPLSGQSDAPENYHNVSYELEERGARTYVTLRQDNNATEDAAKHSEGNWKMMLNGLKEVVERG